MDLTTLQTNLKRTLRHLGTFTQTASLARLNTAILAAAQTIRDRYAWGWKGKSTYSLTTTAGTKGPYAVPSDFEAFPIDERINKFLWEDQQQIYTIIDSTTRRWDIFWDEQANKFQFLTDPGGQTLTLYYIPTFDIDVDNLSTTLTNFPNYLYKCFEKLCAAHLYDEPQNKKLSQALEAEGLACIDLAYANYRRQKRKGAQRTPIGLNGASYSGIAQSEPFNPNVARMRT